MRDRLQATVASNDRRLMRHELARSGRGRYVATAMTRRRRPQEATATPGPHLDRARPARTGRRPGAGREGAGGWTATVNARPLLRTQEAVQVLAVGRQRPPVGGRSSAISDCSLAVSYQ